MHDWMGWGWGGMWLGPLFMLIPLVLLVAAVVVLLRWMGVGSGDGGGRVRTAREILDERYARGDIDREEYSGGATTSEAGRDTSWIGHGGGMQWLMSFWRRSR
jgi:putative membrane protein